MINVLIVDDESFLREMYGQHIVARLPVAITEAGSGNEAIRLLKGEKNFDFVVSDIRMNDGDGYDLLNFVRTMGRPPFFIFYSGEINPSLPAVDSHFLGCIEKLELDRLIEAIEGAITRANAFSWRRMREGF